MQMSQGLVDVLQMFPAVQAAFGYGSGIFDQPGLYAKHSRDKPMLDFILAVECPLKWHAQNLDINRHHYSCLGGLGPSAVTRVATRVGAGVYFNTMVHWQGKLVKYGVVETMTLIHDLTRWDSLYCAGRLHKPVAHLQEHNVLAQPLQQNWSAAVAVALLQLPTAFDNHQLLTRICEISYFEDIRMAFAEDSQKVQKLVTGSWDRLMALYVPVLESAAGIQRNHHYWLQDDSPAWRSHLVAQLPQRLLSGIAVRCGLAPLSALPPVLTRSSLTRTSLKTAHQGSSSHVGARVQASKADPHSSTPKLHARDSLHSWDLKEHAKAAMNQRFASESQNAAPDATRRQSIAATAVRRPDLSQLLQASTGQIVRASSRRQAFAGILSAGMVRSVRYSAAKVGKALRSRGML